MTLKIINKSNNPTPRYATRGSAGLDLKADGQTCIDPHSRALIKTNLYVAVPNGMEMQIRPKSGLALKKGLTVLNTPGTVDSDYRGNVGVILFNTTDKEIVIEAGDDIAQAVINSYVRVDIEEVEELNETDRGQGGFGSTSKGVKIEAKSLAFDVNRKEVENVGNTVKHIYNTVDGILPCDMWQAEFTKLIKVLDEANITFEDIKKYSYASGMFTPYGVQKPIDATSDIKHFYRVFITLKQ